MKNIKKITICICIILVAVSGIFYIRNNINSAGGSDDIISQSVLSDVYDNYILNNEVASEEMSGSEISNNGVSSDEISNNGISDKETSNDGISNNEILNGESVSSGTSDNNAVSTITVYICGAVKRPGVYNFSQGSRICDAVKKAGGFKKSAAKVEINLADTLSDGEQIIILTKKQAKKRAASVLSGTASGTADTAASIDTTDKSGLVNINTADKNELMTLSGIGESKAEAILAYRQNNPFYSIEDIKNVSGIKDGVFNQIRDNITV